MKEEVIELPFEVEVASQSIMELLKNGYTEIPLGQASSLGVAGTELIHMIDQIRIPGGEGVYRVSFPKGVNGALSMFKNEDAYFGAIRGEHGFVGQARLNPVYSFNPTQAFMAIALMDISMKLGEIQKTQATILNFLYTQDESEIYGGYDTLNEDIGYYKHNWNQENFIRQKLGSVQNIESKMRDKIQSYRLQINTILSTPDAWHFYGDAAKKINDLKRYLRLYHDANYLLAYAFFFETLLHRNFTSEYLRKIQSDLNGHARQYEVLYNQSYEWAKEYLDSSMNKAFRPMLSWAQNTSSRLLTNSHAPFRHKIITDQELYRSVDEQMKGIALYERAGTSEFVAELAKIESMFNRETNMYIEGDNLYISMIVSKEAMS